jgi:DNA-binding transcriptional regulator LsrR (DeoR family)
VAKRADRIREMAEHGLSKSEIARRLQISRTSVRRLLGQA